MYLLIAFLFLGYQGRIIQSWSRWIWLSCSLVVQGSEEVSLGDLFRNLHLTSGDSVKEVDHFIAFVGVQSFCDDGSLIVCTGVSIKFDLV